MGEATLTELLVQTGGLGLAGYLVWWLTKKLNGKIDRLVEATRQATSATEVSNTLTRELIGAVKELRDHFERTR